MEIENIILICVWAILCIWTIICCLTCIFTFIIAYIRLCETETRFVGIMLCIAGGWQLSSILSSIGLALKLIQYWK